LGTAELTAFFHVDGVVKNSGSSSGTINTTFAAPDLSFDYLAAGEQLNITYAVQLDDHAGGISTQNVMVTVIGTNDKPVFLCGPDTEHLAEGQHVDPSGNLTADGDLLFSDVDLSDTHTVSTTVTASRSGGGAVPIPTPPCWRHFPPRWVRTRPGHLLGEVDWQFALANTSISFLNSGETLTLVYQVKVQDPSGDSIPRASPSRSSAPTIRWSSPAVLNPRRYRSWLTPPALRRSTPRQQCRPERWPSPTAISATPTPSR
jgi:VCBS repeat-containing protein